MPVWASTEKPDGSPVTRFNRESEQQIRPVLANDPDYSWAVLGEEFGGDTQGVPLRRVRAHH